MEELLGLGGGIVGLVLIVLIGLAAILWIFLPFAVFGVKDKLSIVIMETRKTNKLLQTIVDRTAQSQDAHKS